MPSKNAFTLLEILLSITVIAFMGAILAPVYYSFNVNNDLALASITVVQSLRRAQVLSQAVDGDINWGVNIVQGKITLFKGQSFITRDPNFDEDFTISDSITASGLQEIVFAKFSGMPISTGSLTLTTGTNESKTITINIKGMVSY